MPGDDQVNDDGNGDDEGTIAPADSQPIPGPKGPEAGLGDLMTGNAPRRRRSLIRGLRDLIALVVVWLLAAYVILPALWRHYEHHPALEDASKTTVIAQGIPGDPLNVGLIGAEEELVHALISSGWDPPDSVTLRTIIRIARSVLRDRPYPEAPVSSLFLFGRKQDLAPLFVRRGLLTIRKVMSVGNRHPRLSILRWGQLAHAEDLGN